MNKLFLVLFVTVFSTTGCGGGGGKSNDTPPVTSSSSLSSTTLSSSSSISSSSSSAATSKSSSSMSMSSSALSSVTASTASSTPFTLTSTSFISDTNIPIKYSCFSSEISPQLKWEITSDAVKSFALVMEDIDAIPIVQHPYVHWNVYNIPGNVREIAEGATLHAMPVGSVEGANDDGVPKYAGPCPPSGTGTHHYHFALYALNKETIVFNAGHSIERSKFETDHAADIIQKVEIIGLFTH